MIVNQVNEGWEIFSHSSHGLLAGKVAQEVQDRYKNENWVATLAAIIEHDDRQLDFNEKDYLTKIGTPQDFLLEKRNVREIVKRSERLINQAEKKSTWVALLIIHHIRFIYEELARDKKTIANFLEDLKETEHQYIKEQKLSRNKVESIYEVMKFADRCSLILCQDALPSKNRNLEINNSIEGKTYWIQQKESMEIQITPWIFKNDSFTLNADYKLLKQSSFSNNKEFEKLLKDSPVKLKSWKFSK